MKLHTLHLLALAHQGLLAFAQDKPSPEEAAKCDGLSKQTGLQFTTVPDGQGGFNCAVCAGTTCKPRSQAISCRWSLKPYSPLVKTQTRRPVYRNVVRAKKFSSSTLSRPKKVHAATADRYTPSTQPAAKVHAAPQERLSREANARSPLHPLQCLTCQLKTPAINVLKTMSAPATGPLGSSTENAIPWQTSMVCNSTEIWQARINLEVTSVIWSSR